MDSDEFQSLIAGILTDCATYTDTELSEDRAIASDYYLGKPFGNEEDNRSQVVLTEVRDCVQGLLPSMLRVIFGPERVVEFAPKGPKNVAFAKQASDYVQYVFAQDNPGFLITHSVLKDGLVKKLGVAKWGWDKSSEKRTHRLDNVTRAQIEALVADEDIELTRAEPTGMSPQLDPQTPPEQLFSIELTHRDKEGRAVVYAVPPEEFLFSRTARSIDDALMVAHRTLKTTGELLALGVSQDDIDEYGGSDNSLSTNSEVIARGMVVGVGTQMAPDAGDANDLILYVEGYPRIDFDGDGKAELRRVCTIGTGFHVVSNVPVDARPFALFTPDPEPHTLLGGSWADRTMDMQKVKSSVLRATLDSLALSITPRTAIVEGKVNLADAMNTELGAVIRTKDITAVQPFAHPFVGADALPVLQMLSDVVEGRTGQRKGTVGLDGDALQSTGKEGVNAAIDSSQAQTELVTRIFAETFLKPLFMGLLRLLVENQPRARMVKLRDEWVSVDPRSWDADMEVTVRVALGSTLVQQKVETLISISEAQKDVLMTLGPDNPLVHLSQYRNTLARIVELRGFPDTASFFMPVPDDWKPPPPQTPAETPEQTLAAASLKVEQMRVQKELQIKEAELTLKEVESRRDHDLEVAKHAADVELKKLEIEYRFAGANLDREFQQGMKQAELELSNRTATNADFLTAHDQDHDQSMELQGQAHDQQLARDQQAHEQAMAEQAGAAEGAE